MFDLIIVSCAKTKAAEPKPARELYTSPLFRMSRDFAELNGADWMIASAKFGLVSPLSIIRPYDETIGELDEPGLTMFRELSKLTLGYWLAEWRCSIAHDANAFPQVAILAGERYVRELLDATWLKSIEDRLCLPLAGKQIGERLQWLKAAVAESRQLAKEADRVIGRALTGSEVA